MLRKSKLIIVLFGLLFGIIAVRVLYFGADLGMKKDISSNENSTYNLEEISKHKTPYVGDSGRVSAIAWNLPVPDDYFKQRYISMETSDEPYSLTVIMKQHRR